MKRILLKTSTGVTQIIIGRNLAVEASQILAKMCEGRRIAIVTDSYLARKYAGKFAAALKKNGDCHHYGAQTPRRGGQLVDGDCHRFPCDLHIVTVPRGEAAKKMSVAEQLCSRLLKVGIGRDDRLVAFGGGSVGDLAGFVAATYMRGIPYVQSPTTLNAQVDSSIGGKTGVNLPEGKNIVGAFHQPRAVFIDPSFLRTLPERQFNAGMAEVIKTAAIGNGRLFAFIEGNVRAILKRDTKALGRIIVSCVRFKARIVEVDEKESGPRMLLNFGHTFGHAIETATNYRKYLHGEAVAIGMVAASRIAAARGLCAESLPERLSALLKKFSLPTEIPPAILKRIPQAMARDKKARAGGLTLVFPRRTGAAEIVTGFDAKDVRQMLKDKTGSDTKNG